MAYVQKQRPLLAEGPDAQQRTVTFNRSTKNVTLDQTVKVKWQDSALERKLRGIQVTGSESHPGWRRFAGKQDIGGNFSTRSRRCETVLVSQFLRGVRVNSTQVQETTRTYTGYLVAVPPSEIVAPPAISGSSDAALNAFGATAVARCKPTNAVADLSVALGELYRERLPSISRWDEIRDGTDRARKAGSEYLKSEFGWKPLIGELNDFGRAVFRSGEILSQYERDAGRLVRRQFQFPTEKSTQVSNSAGSFRPTAAVDIAGYSVPGPAAEGQIQRRRETSTRRWFSGAFQYSLPPGYNSSDAVTRHAARASVLFGAELTPSTVWNLAPWSWAVDWFSNVGDVISNASDYVVDGLVMRYGYIMEHSLIRDTWTYSGPTHLQTPAVPQPLVLVSETKLRRKANPFGFGVTWEGLTPRQIAISVALGLTR